MAKIIHAKEIATAYKKGNRMYFSICILLLCVVLSLAYIGMVYGNTVYTLREVWENLTGIRDEARFTIVTLRLPRVLIGLLSGLAFGISGNTFQKLFRNPLASPDIIGVTSGAALGAMLSILVFRFNGTYTSIIALVSGMATAILIYAISGGSGFLNGRLILIGIGVQAFLRAMTSWILLKTASYDVGNALRWLSGSLNNMKIESVPPLCIILAVVGLGVFLLNRRLAIMQLGDDLALTLGTKPGNTRIWLLFLSLTLTAFATAACGPIASVAFLSGPIAQRITKTANNNMLASGLVGAILVLSSDLFGQYALAVRYPVGVITGILGAPYLLLLLLRMGKKGAIV